MACRVRVFRGEKTGVTYLVCLTLALWIGRSGSAEEGVQGAFCPVGLGLEGVLFFEVRVCESISMDGLGLDSSSKGCGSTPWLWAENADVSERPITGEAIRNTRIMLSKRDVCLHETLLLAKGCNLCQEVSCNRVGSPHCMQ